MHTMMSGRYRCFDHLIIFPHISAPRLVRGVSVAGFICSQNFFPRNLGTQQTLDSSETTSERGKSKHFYGFILYDVIHVSKNFISLSKFFLSFRLLCLRSLPSLLFLFREEKSKDLHA